MPDRQQPTDLTYSPPRYTPPAWDEGGQWVEVFVPPDERVGWLVRQGDRLAWLSSAPPGTDAHTLRWLVQEALAVGAAEGRPPIGVWEQLLEDVPHGPIRQGALQEALAAFMA